MTGSAGLDRRRAGWLRERLAPSVEARDVPALAALVARGGDVQVEVLGSLALGDARPLPRRAIFRIASLTEPITAAGAMILIDDGVVALNDPVQRFIPELADRRVLRGLEAGLDDTTPAERSITVEDLLTFRLGFGAIMALPGTYPIQDAESELGLRTLGPPWTHRHRLALTSGLRSSRRCRCSTNPGLIGATTRARRCWGSSSSGPVGSRSSSSCASGCSNPSE